MHAKLIPVSDIIISASDELVFLFRPKKRDTVRALAAVFNFTINNKNDSSFHYKPKYRTIAS